MYLKKGKYAWNSFVIYDRKWQNITKDSQFHLMAGKERGKIKGFLRPTASTYSRIEIEL
jgi:hypothetical protein